MSAAADLRPRLVSSIALARLEGRLRGIADTIDTEAEIRAGHGREDDVLRGLASDVREVVRDLEKHRAQLRELLDRREA